MVPRIDTLFPFCSNSLMIAELFLLSFVVNLLLSSRPKSQLYDNSFSKVVPSFFLFFDFVC